MTIEERNKIFEDNINLIHYVLHERGYYESDEIYDDIFQECSVFVLDKLPNWNEERGNITTYIHMLVTYAIGLFCRAERRIPLTISENIPLYISDDGDTIYLRDSIVYADSIDIISDCSKKCDLECVLKKAETTYLKDKYSNRFIKNIPLLKEYYLEDKTIAELAEQYGVSRQCIYKKINRCLAQLRKLIKEKGE